MSPVLLDPIGFRLDGRPFYGFFGAGDDDGDGGDGGDSGDGGDGADGDGGTEKDPVKVLETTLTKVRNERKAAQDEFRPYKAMLRGLGIQNPEQLKELLTKGSGAGASGTGKQDPVDIEKVRAEARAEVQLEANRDLALARVEAKAKGMFADPDDAVEHLRRNVDDLLGRDGKPDPKAIERELDDLLAAKPHWGVKQTQEFGLDGGARTSSGGRTQTMDGFLRQESARKRGR